MSNVIDMVEAFHLTAIALGIPQNDLELALCCKPNGEYYWAARVWGSGVADCEYEVSATAPREALRELVRELPNDLRKEST